MIRLRPSFLVLSAVLCSTCLPSALHAAALFSSSFDEAPLSLSAPEPVASEPSGTPPIKEEATSSSCIWTEQGQFGFINGPMWVGHGVRGTGSVLTHPFRAASQHLWVVVLLDEGRGRVAITVDEQDAPALRTRITVDGCITHTRRHRMGPRWRVIPGLAREGWSYTP